jgi:hypothetical protein
MLLIFFQIVDMASGYQQHCLCVAVVDAFSGSTDRSGIFVVFYTGVQQVIFGTQ